MALSTYFFGKALLHSYGIMLRLSQRHSCEVMALGTVFLKDTIQSYGIRHGLSEIAKLWLKMLLQIYGIRCSLSETAKKIIGKAFLDYILQSYGTSLSQRHS